MSYWIVKGRVAVRRVVNRCISCRGRQALPGVQKVANLPADRVSPNKPPFSFVGFECFGLFWVKMARRQVKHHGVLFTCLATRAIHLEVPQSMDTDSFVNSMHHYHKAKYPRSNEVRQRFEFPWLKHLLLLWSGPKLPPGLFRKEDGYSRIRWRQVQYLADVFWWTWIREYLPQLHERPKWAYPSRKFAVDDIVLVVDYRVPRSSWPLGRITSVHKNSTDEHVRSVTVKTRTSLYDRPVDKIVLLESVEMSEGIKHY